MDCVPCIYETPTGPVSPNGYYLYSGHVGQLLTCYKYKRVLAHVDVVGETSLGAFPICEEC